MRNRRLLVGAGIENQPVNMPQIVFGIYQFFFTTADRVGEITFETYSESDVINPDELLLVEEVEKDEQRQAPGNGKG